MGYTPPSGETDQAAKLILPSGFQIELRPIEGEKISEGMSRMRSDSFLPDMPGQEVSDLQVQAVLAAMHRTGLYMTLFDLPELPPLLALGEERLLSISANVTNEEDDRALRETVFRMIGNHMIFVTPTGTGEADFEG